MADIFKERTMAWTGSAVELVRKGSTQDRFSKGRQGTGIECGR